jgi:hypothetical protein
MYGKAVDALPFISANFMHLLHSKIIPTMTNLSYDYNGC